MVGRGRTALLPEGQRVYAVGDIHGMGDLLEVLLAKISSDIESHPEDEPRIVFLGDYIDRGTDSRGVIDRLVSSVLPAPSTFLMGNHEELMLRFLDEPGVAEEWRGFGGLETLHSYGVDISEVRLGRGYERARSELMDRLPHSHLEFLRKLQVFAEAGNYFFCHAGIRPGVGLERQHPSDLLWIREEFLRFRGSFGKVVVHGHTPAEEVYLGANRINVDTGAYATGLLSAVCLVGNERRVIAATTMMTEAAG